MQGTFSVFHTRAPGQPSSTDFRLLTPPACSTPRVGACGRSVQSPCLVSHATARGVARGPGPRLPGPTRGRCSIPGTARHERVTRAPSAGSPPAQAAPSTAGRLPRPAGGAGPARLGSSDRSLPRLRRCARPRARQLRGAAGPAGPRGPGRPSPGSALCPVLTRKARRRQGLTLPSPRGAHKGRRRGSVRGAGPGPLVAATHRSEPRVGHGGDTGRAAAVTVHSPGTCCRCSAAESPRPIAEARRSQGL